MASTALSSPHTGSLAGSVFVAGFIAGTFDALYAVIYFGLTRHIPAIRIFQHVASGLLGPASFSFGWKSFALGLACHFTIAIGAALTFAIASSPLPILVRRPLLTGPVFCIGIYLFMNFVVAPLSRVTRSAGPSAMDVIFTGVLVHMFLIGLPIALVISKRVNGNHG